MQRFDLEYGMSFGYCAADMNEADDGAWVKFVDLPTWQPIETAPKEAAPILGWSEEEGIAIVKWDSKCWEVIHDAEDCAWNTYSPTHWQPLPVPPQ